MKTRRARAALALLLLCAAWPALGTLAVTALTTGITAAGTHPTPTLTTIAALLLLATVPGPIERTLTRAAARTAPGRKTTR